MRVLITGGAGFIGCNYADRRLAAGDSVVILDNLSRPRTELNLRWLQERHGSSLQFIRGDIRDYETVARAAEGAEAVFHLAAQVAVTTSVVNPREDLEINVLGSFNVLEAVRNVCPQAPAVFASTNKVYGGLEDLQVVETPTRHEIPVLPLGVPETQPLDFHSPYGCSKGTADQYFRDYARIYGLKTVVLRQSCIYGTRQFGVEDQGWVAHFAISAAKGRPLTIFGDGKQVRDLLWVEDLMDAYDAVLERMEGVRGRIYNVGGGPDFALSIWAEFAPMLEKHAGPLGRVQHAEPRAGDQKLYISDIRKARRELGWSPRVSPEAGLQTLWRWIKENEAIF
jgi:CDP-paratose 2-epimerase